MFLFVSASVHHTPRPSGLAVIFLALSLGDTRILFVTFVSCCLFGGPVAVCGLWSVGGASVRNGFSEAGDVCILFV